MDKKNDIQDAEDLQEEYFNEMRPCCDYTRSYLEEIQSYHNTMKDSTIFYLVESWLNVNEKSVGFSKRAKEINDLLNQKNDHIKLLQLLNDKIIQKMGYNCKHEWITDSIDIDPDTSKTIEYCTKCKKSK